GLTGSAAGLALATIAPGFGVLAVAMFVAGLGGAGVWVPAPGIAATAVGPARRGLAIGLVGSGIGLGIVVAGPLTNVVRASVGDDGAWRPVYGIQAIVAVVVLVGLVTLVRLPPATDVAARVSVVVLRSVPGWRWLLAGFSLFGLSYSLYFYFLVAQLQQQGWSPSASSTIFALTGIASATGGVLFGRVSDHVGRPRTMAAGFLLLAASPLLTLHGGTAAVIVAAVAFGFAVAGTPTTIGAVVADVLDGRAFGAAFGTLTLVFGVSQLVGPPFAGVVAEASGSFAIPFVIASGVALLGIGCAAGLAAAGRRSLSPSRSEIAGGSADVVRSPEGEGSERRS
ncbi:MAG: MFS transporter, partial [Acidimicrobiia bacterium]|nr:MFS transporter [Acidimicrobiia bacterium]